MDRDGVINVKAPEGQYITSWADFEFVPGALEGIRLLTEAQLPAVVVTNQRGIARGALSEHTLRAIHRRMRERIAAAGGRIDAVYHCPHEGDCGCRKPQPGMLLQAARELGLTLTDSALIGDSESDMQAAGAVGAVRVLVAACDCATLADIEADHIAVDLHEAVRWLLDGGARAGADG